MSKMVTVICNKCGKKMTCYDERFSIYKRMGVGTEYDGDELTLDLCSSCMTELIKSCKLSPIVEGNDEAFSEANGNE